MGVDGACVGLLERGERLLGEDGARDGASAPLDEEREDGELGRRQRRQPPLDIAVRASRSSATPCQRTTRLGSSSTEAQPRTDAGDELLDPERLGDEVGGAELEGAQAVGQIGARGEDDDRAPGRDGGCCSRTSNPLWPGSIRSSTTMSYLSASMRRAPSAPSVDRSTSRPAPSRPRTMPGCGRRIVLDDEHADGRFGRHESKLSGLRAETGRGRRRLHGSATMRVRILALEGAPLTHALALPAHSPRSLPSRSPPAARRRRPPPGRAGPGSGDDGGADASSTLQTVSFQMQETVPAGGEMFDCQYVQLPDAKAWLVAAQHDYTPGSHHLLLYTTDLTSIPAGGGPDSGLLRGHGQQHHERRARRPLRRSDADRRRDLPAGRGSADERERGAHLPGALPQRERQRSRREGERGPHARHERRPTSSSRRGSSSSTIRSSTCLRGPRRRRRCAARSRATSPSSTRRRTTTRAASATARGTTRPPTSSRRRAFYTSDSWSSPDNAKLDDADQGRVAPALRVRLRQHGGYGGVLRRAERADERDVHVHRHVLPGDGAAHGLLPAEPGHVRDRGGDVQHDAELPPGVRRQGGARGRWAPGSRARLRADVLRRTAARRRPGSAHRVHELHGDNCKSQCSDATSSACTSCIATNCGTQYTACQSHTCP